MEFKISGVDSFLSSLLPPSSKWSCLVSLKVLSLQVISCRFLTQPCVIKHIRFSWPWKSVGTTYRLSFITPVIPIALINDAQVLQYDNTKLSFHCHTCSSASAIATEKSNVKLSGQSLAIHGEDIRVERPHITDNILRINSPLRLKPMASLIGDICASEVVTVDEEILSEHQEITEEPVSPPRTAFMPISKPTFHRPGPSSLSNAAGGTFNPSPQDLSFQPPAAALHAPLHNNPLFKSWAPRFLGPAPHTDQIGHELPPR